MQNILVPIDFSEATDKILNMAKNQAKAFHAKVWLIHVAAPDPDFVGYDVGPQYIRDNRAENLKEEHQKLHDLSQTLNHDSIECDPLLVQGPTSKTILDESKKLSCDLIIIGSHGHGIWHEMLVGSVCDDVVKKSKIPVLVVPIKA